MRKSKKVLALAMALCMTVGLTACGGNNGTANTPTGTVANENSGAGTLDLTACIASEPETIDPSLNSSVDGATYIMHTFEGLMKYQQVGETDSEIVYGQAESHEVSDDGLVYTFHLRDDIYWSDGVAVTANDFVYGWQRLVDPETASDYCYIIDMVKNSTKIQAGELPVTELGIVALDEKTVEITLESPCPYFMELGAFASLMPLRQDIVEGNDSWTFDPATYIGNGCYKITEWEHDSYIKMVKNEYYYDQESLGPDSITWRLMDDANAMLAAWRNGEIDFINDIPVDEVKTLLADGSLKILPQLGIYAVVFQTEVAPFDDPLVREALSLAIDRNYICDNITQMGQIPATAWVPAGISDGNGGDFRELGGEYYSVAAEDYEANCEKARELLAQAGYPNGEGFPVISYSYNTSDSHKKIAEAVAYMWESELGIQTQLANQDWNVFLQTREDGDFEAARHGWVADYNDSANFLELWTTGNSNNYAHWSNEEYDSLIAGAVLESDLAKRAEMLHQAEDILMADNIVAPLYFYVDKYMLNDRVDNIYHTPMGYFFLMSAKLK